MHFLLIAVEAGLNQGHVVLQVEPNFTLDIHKPSLTDAIKVLIQVNGLTMKWVYFRTEEGYFIKRNERFTIH